MKQLLLTLSIMLLLIMTSAATSITVKFKKPSSWTTVNLYTYGPELTGGWPGTTLTESNGWYIYTTNDAFVSGNFIFNNGTGEQSVDIPVSSNLCIQASDTKNGNGQYPVNVIACTSGGITVKFQKPTAWTAVNLYAYVNGASVVGGWPGVSLTDVDGWYSYTFDASITSVSLIFNQNGSPQLPDTYITTSSCFSSNGADIIAVNCQPTGISDNKIKTPTLYPNQITDRLNFSDSENIKKIAIYSIAGNNILSISNITKDGTIDVSAIKSGIYFVNIQFENGKQQIEKIIKL